MAEESGAVTPTQKDGAPVETKSANLNTAADDYKRDMLKYKDEAAALREKLSDKNLAEEQKKGNLTAVIDTLKQERNQAKSELLTTKSEYASGKIAEGIKLAAAKSGCTDPETFYKLIDQSEIDVVELDAKFNPSATDISGIIEKNMQKYQHLGFFNKDVKIVDGSPRIIKKAAKVAKPLADLTHEELMVEAGKAGLKRI